MKLHSYGISNVGMKRFQNEDAYLVNEKLDLYMVADGMGGHLGGEKASRMAVATVEEIIQKLYEDPEVTHIHGVTTQEAEPGNYLMYAIQEACHRIYQQANADQRYKGMGTTAVAALFQDQKLYLANVGDSRAYLIRDGDLEQLTEDHSLVREQLKAGMISQDDAKNHKMKNVITRSVGFQEEVEVDIHTHELKAGDQLLLCSDGLSNLVEDQEIQETIKNLEPQEACEKLVNLANLKGGDDNITVLIVQLDEIK